MKDPITSCEDAKRLLAAALRRIPEITANGVSRTGGDAVDLEQRTMSAVAIPQAMRDARRWIHWKKLDGRKVPLPAPRVERGVTYTNDATWRTYDDAAALLRDGRGLGFMLGEGWAGVDLDDVRDPQTGVLTPEAQAIVDALHSYTEVSPSGTGVKVFVKIVPDVLANRKREGLEIYTGARFFTVTSDHLPGTPTTVDVRTDAVRELLLREFGSTDDTRSTRRLAYVGLDLDAVLAQFTVTRTQRTAHKTRYEMRCPFHPALPPEGHGSSAAIAYDHRDGNLVAGCFGARCMTGYGPNQDRPWMMRDLLNLLLVRTCDERFDPDRYEALIAPDSVLPEGGLSWL